MLKQRPHALVRARSVLRFQLLLLLLLFFPSLAFPAILFVVRDRLLAKSFLPLLLSFPRPLVLVRASFGCSCDGNCSMLTCQ